MLILRGNTDKLQLVTGSAVDIEVHASVMQADNAAPPVVQALPNFGPRASITTATTTDIVDATGLTSGHVYNVKTLTAYNNHASTSSVVTMQVTDGTDTTVLAKVTLLAGESLVLDESGRWFHLDANGGEYPSVGNAATQAEMEAGTATDKYVTPQGVNWHPGVNKAWLKAGITGNLLASWNITSLTDTGTGVLTITIATDFSSVDYCVNVSVEATATTWAVANTRECHIRSATMAVGSVAVDCVDNTATTSLVKDPTSWHVSMLGDQ